MDSIILTKEHKSKLLEMCKELFPKYTIIPDNPNPNFLTISWFTNLGYFINLMNDETKENTLIHWFEFCICWLATSIYNKRKINHFSILEYRGFLCQSVDHPVDFLYEEFKKLK